MTVNAPRRPRRYRQPDPKFMTFVEHLEELRHRLIICALAIALGSVVGWFLAGRAIHLLDQPLCKALGHKNCALYTPQVYGAFTLNLKIAIIIGFAIALPVTLYQIWGFVAPAFGPAANFWAPLWILSALLLFFAGAVTGYFVIPLALNFFDKFSGQTIQILPFASEYVSFVVLILAVFGVSFELPLVLVSLTAAGITSSRWLSSKRIYFFFGIFAVATIVTPGADWISPLILGGILYVLFEASILVSRLLGK
jgi:sec-independent protein translocase protein TatC